MNSTALFSSATDEWATPDAMFAKLDAEFEFVVDVCANEHNTKCALWFSKESNGLAATWSAFKDDGAIWMNPPYGEPEDACWPVCTKKRCAKRGFHLTAYKPGIRDWVAKAAEEAKLGATVVALLPSRTDTKWWHAHIWDAARNGPRPGVEVRLIKGRLKFGGSKNSAPFPSAVVVFRPV